jgi:alanine racemase
MDDNLYMEIDLKQLANNISKICQVKDIIPVIKSNAYGMGDIQVAQTIRACGLKYVAVVDIFEAIRIAKNTKGLEILILNSVKKEDLEYLNYYSNLIISLNSKNDFEVLENINFNRRLKVHIQIDTGMNRLGFKDYFEYEEVVKKILLRKDLYLKGIYTHYTDSINYPNQIERFKPFLKTYNYPMIHTASSSTYKIDDVGNYLRLGVELYSGEDEDLRQIVKIGCYPLEVKLIKKGETIGYDRTYQADEDQFIAILPIGYSNGFRRSLSGFPVLVNGKRYPTIGKVCMNHLFVRVDEAVNINSEFIITSPELPVSEMATYLKTVSHEILCMFNIRNILYRQ